MNEPITNETRYQRGWHTATAALCTGMIGLGVPAICAGYAMSPNNYRLINAGISSVFNGMFIVLLVAVGFPMLALLFRACGQFTAKTFRQWSK